MSDRRTVWATRTLRWGAGIAAAYLLLWGVTAAFGPGAVVEFFRSRQPDRMAVMTDARFTGTGLDFRPDPEPDAPNWCCIGRPAAWAPLVVSVEVAMLDRSGILAGGVAGQATFLWTPWRVYYLGETKHWAA